MTLYKIPTDPKETNYQFSIVLGGVVFFFDIMYNVRNSRYSLSILDSDKNHIVSGIPILTNIPLTETFKYLDIPEGRLLPISVDNENAELNELGDKVELYYDD